jgi:hypothetical protein
MKASRKGTRRGKLEAAAESFLGGIHTPPPTSRLREYGLQRVFARAATVEKEGTRAEDRRAYGRPVLLHRVLMVIMAVLLLTVASTASAYALSYDAQPGSALYGTKIFFERASVALTRSSAEDARLEMEFSERRMQELEGMVAAGDQNGAERWLREYRRNIAQAAELVDRADDDAEELCLQYQHMLARHSHLMSGMHGAQPPGLAHSVESAYNACEQERMRRRQGQEDPSSPSQPPQGQQQQGSSAPMMGDSSTQEAPSYPADTPAAEGRNQMQDTPGSQDSSTQPDATNPDSGQGQQEQKGWGGCVFEDSPTSRP